MAYPLNSSCKFVRVGNALYHQVSTILHDSSNAVFPVTVSIKLKENCHYFENFFYRESFHMIPISILTCNFIGHDSQWWFGRNKK